MTSGGAAHMTVTHRERNLKWSHCQRDLSLWWGDYCSRESEETSVRCTLDDGDRQEVQCHPSVVSKEGFLSSHLITVTFPLVEEQRLPLVHVGVEVRADGGPSRGTSGQAVESWLLPLSQSTGAELPFHSGVTAIGATYGSLVCEVEWRKG